MKSSSLPTILFRWYAESRLVGAGREVVGGKLMACWTCYTRGLKHCSIIGETVYEDAPSDLAPRSIESTQPMPDSPITPLPDERTATKRVLETSPTQIADRALAKRPKDALTNDGLDLANDPNMPDPPATSVSDGPSLPAQLGGFRRLALRPGRAFIQKLRDVSGSSLDQTESTEVRHTSSNDSTESVHPPEQSPLLSPANPSPPLEALERSETAPVASNDHDHFNPDLRTPFRKRKLLTGRPPRAPVATPNMPDTALAKARITQALAAASSAAREHAESMKAKFAECHSAVNDLDQQLDDALTSAEHDRQALDEVTKRSDRQAAALDALDGRIASYSEQLAVLQREKGDLQELLRVSNESLEKVKREQIVVESRIREALQDRDHSNFARDKAEKEKLSADHDRALALKQLATAQEDRAEAIVAMQDFEAEVLELESQLALAQSQLATARTAKAKDFTVTPHLAVPAPAGPAMGATAEAYKQAAPARSPAYSDLTGALKLHGLLGEGEAPHTPPSAPAGEVKAGEEPEGLGLDIVAGAMSDQPAQHKDAGKTVPTVNASVSGDAGERGGAGATAKEGRTGEEGGPAEVDQGKAGPVVSSAS